MNIFGAFTFGSLIKTFLPGFVWLVALCLVEIDIAQYNPYDSACLKVLAAKDQSALWLAIAFPLSVLLGLLSNIVIFMGLNDRLVRQPFRESHAELHRLHTSLVAKLNHQCWTVIDLPDATLRDSFDAHTDPEVILVERIGFEQLAYVREQYWFHLEFQLNLMFSMMALLAALALSAILNLGAESSFRIALILYVIGYCIFIGLLSAARKNYARHIAKIASLIAALLSRPPSATP